MHAALDQLLPPSWITVFNKTRGWHHHRHQGDTRVGSPCANQHLGLGSLEDFVCPALTDCS